ncbi:hypothetical protein FRC09_014395 [Ceratobasidium sp. 395]|nr:hypothetical protein FRC09_014395 [Ceratobasidium sp. 395]
MTLMLPSSHSKDYSAQRSDAGRFSFLADPDPNSADKPPATSNDSDLAGQTKRNNADAGGEQQAPISNDQSKHTTGEQAAPQASPDENEDGGYVEGPRPDYDDYGQELGKNARFWKTYVKEAYRWDADMVDGWNKSLDLILIFVSSTLNVQLSGNMTAMCFITRQLCSLLYLPRASLFVIESSKSPQPDPAETSAQTLSVISVTLLAMANAQSGAPFDFIPPVPPTFVAPTSAVWVNALWYLSLSLSVGVSLVALLGKDWARAYMAELTGQPYQQARKRQQRWDSLEKWRMPQLIMFLPIVLHLALLLFAIGLTIYLWRIHLGAAAPVLVVTFAATAVYVVSTVLPLVHKNCPYGTPLAQLLPILVGYFELPSTIKSSTKVLFHQSRVYFKQALASVQVYYRRAAACMRIWQPRQSDPEALIVGNPQEEESTVPQGENIRIDEDTLMDNLTSRAIAWLLVNYEDTQSADIALQAIAGANAHLPMGPLVACSVDWLLTQRLDNCYATRQKTGKQYLKDIRLLEPATLYYRASVAVHMWRKTSPTILDLSYYYHYHFNLAETPLCIVDHSLKRRSRSPNKAAFALASWALIELDRLPVTKWVTSTVELFESHCNDSAALDGEALSMLMKSVSYVLGAHAFEHTPLLLALVGVLTSSRSSRSQVAYQVGVALIGPMILKPDTTLNQPPSGVHSEVGSETRKVHYNMRFLDSVKRPELIPPGLLEIGLLELLKHLPQTRKRSDLVTINDALQKYDYRQDSLEIQGFVIATTGYNSRYLADVVIPRVKPADDGSFAASELARATYLSVVNMEFLDTLTLWSRDLRIVRTCMTAQCPQATCGSSANM